MTEPVLTDDEKNALLDGVTSGAVEVQSNGGPQYASVRPFEVSPRSRIVSNSYPRLQSVNQLFSERLAGQAEQLLQHDIDVSPTGIELRPWSDYCVKLAAPCVAVVFSAAPLTGNALIVLQAELVGHLVEAFFGSEVGIGSATGGGSFTPGELSVSTLFSELIVSTIRDAWQPLMQITPERVRTEINLDMADIARDPDAVIGSSFELSFANHDGAFHVLWPREMVTPLLPAFDGQTRERNVAIDASWEKAIRARLADAPMRITTCVGHAYHALGDLVALSPGDVVPIVSPRLATIMARQVPILKGHFGVFEGQNAVEATEWLHR